MDRITFGQIAKRAFVETRADIRLDKPVRVMTTMVAPFISAAAVYLATKNWSWTGIAGVGVLLAIGLIAFVAKLVTVPIAIANQERDDAAAFRNATIARIAELEASVHRLSSPFEPDLHDFRIFQDGLPCGLGSGVSIEKECVAFSTIENTTGFRQNDAFIFRGMVLRVQQVAGFVASQTIMTVGPQGPSSHTAQNVLSGVRCVIVGTLGAVKVPMT